MDCGFYRWTSHRQSVDNCQPTGVMVTGMPFITEFPESGSISFSSVSTFEFTPARFAATFMRVPLMSCPHPCGRLTTRSRMSLVNSTTASTAPTLLAMRATLPSYTPARCASFGCMCNVQRSLPFTSTSMLCIHELFERK